MRELTDAEKAKLQRGCLFCGGKQFLLGPQALGLSFNIFCFECEAAYNVTHHMLPWQVIAEPGKGDIDQRCPPPVVTMNIETMLATISDKIEETTRAAFDRAMGRTQH